METAKDKAEELYYIYYDIMNPNDDRACYIAIECAKIAVDEIIKQFKNLYLLKSELSYWQEVKNELNKM